MWMTILVWATSAQAACDTAEVERAVASVTEAFRATDLPTAERAGADLKHALACVREPITPEQCSAVHLANAFYASMVGDAAAVHVSLRAMLHANPMATLPPTVVAADHALRYALMRAEEATTEHVAGPAGWLLVDGVKGNAVPVDQPYVLQKSRADGRALGAKLIGWSAPRAP